MAKKCILVSECIPGDIIAQKIVSKYGATIAVENTIINSFIIKRLITFELEYIWIYKHSHDDVSNLSDNNFLNFKRNYKHNIIEINNIINDLSKGEYFEDEKLSVLVNSIYSSINEEYYIVKCISELKTTDEYLYNHSLHVSFYGMLLGKWLGLFKSQIEDLLQAGFLHDIGKTKISPKILNKPDKLNTSEFEEIKKHPVLGYNIVKGLPFISSNVKETILTHHERMNESGYPTKKNGSELSIYAKIISIVDAYDAITSERVYIKRRTPFEAFQILMNDSLGCYDLHILNVFLSNIAACYVGGKVLLNTNEVGEIVYVPPHEITKPIISVNSEYIDLSKKPNIKIISML